MGNDTKAQALPITNALMKSVCPDQYHCGDLKRGGGGSDNVDGQKWYAHGGGTSPRSRYATPRGGRLLGPGTRLPPPPLRALRAHLVTKGQWLLAIHRVAPKVPENFGDPRECRGCAKGAHLGQSLNARFVAWCIMVTPGIGFDFRFCSLCWGPPRMQG